MKIVEAKSIVGVHTHTHTDNLVNKKGIINKDSSIMPIYIG